VELRAARFTHPEHTRSTVAVRRDDGADATLPALMAAPRQRDRRQQRGGRETDDAPHRLTLPIGQANIKLCKSRPAHLLRLFSLRQTDF